MSIKSFVVPESETSDIGLKNINMQRLGQIVALAGKNGSGKTRILSKLVYFLNLRTEILPTIPNLIQNISSLKEAIGSHTDTNSEHAQSANSFQLRLEQGTKRLAIDSTTPLKPLSFVPKSLPLNDPSSFSINQNIESYSTAKTPGLEKYHLSCLPYILYLQTKWWDASHQNQKGSEEKKLKAIDDYNNLKDLISKILNTQLDRTEEGIPTLFGQHYAHAGLSDGQNILLQICVAMHAQNSKLSDTIFILDEPENHLHPSAVIDIFQSLSNLAPNAQIWVATHSVPLLAYISNFDPMSIWYVEDGMISNAGRSPERVLKTLLGDQDRLQQLHNFAGLPSQLALSTYAAESLLPPKTLSYGDKDPQISQIQRMISDTVNTFPVQILDYGAGKGRLLNGLAVELANRSKSIESHIDYYAYDPGTNDHDYCSQVIKSFYHDKKTRLFQSPEDFFCHKKEQSITIAIMCNVLHEIAPSDWLNTFSQGALLDRALSADGYLLIVEDQRIPVGEKAHPLGFLVLDTPHLKVLFSVTEKDIANKKFIADDARNDERLKAHLIAKSLLNRVTTQSIFSAIEALRETAKNNIKKLRKTESTSTYKNGQLHGFWTQQFANASLYIDENRSQTIQL